MINRLLENNFLKYLFIPIFEDRYIKRINNQINKPFKNYRYGKEKFKTEQ